MRKLKNILLLASIFIITVAFNFKDNPSNGWYQQLLPDLGGATIADMTFTDSLTGYMVSNQGFSSNNYILKTTNGGDNWNILVTNTEPFVRIFFLNQNIGFTNAFQKLYKTTNAGLSWIIINLPGDVFGDDMFVLNQDTIWLANSESLVGGVFRTTNGGVNWTQQLFASNLNPTHIYFYNKDIGFTAEDSLYKTTNSGVNWFRVSGGKFNNMQFANELTGWKCDGLIQKTTDGGLNWFTQNLPVQMSGISSMATISVLNKDTIWGGGGYVIYPNTQRRAVVYTSTNGGTNWFYQVPDTTINVFIYLHIQFINKSYGWTYGTRSGAHTKIGGDPLTVINPLSSEFPKQFKLGQNYPNPFNPLTRINYELQITNYVTLKVFDLQGKEVQMLVNKKQSAGSYSAEFNGVNLSSGIYFYTLFLNGATVDTKKMLLIK